MNKIEEMEKQLEALEPSREDFINMRIKHIPFAKLLFWLNFKSEKVEFVYASELGKFMKTSNAWASVRLNDLCKVGILRKKNIGNMVEFHFCLNGGKPLVEKYLEKAKRTLDLQ